MDERFKKTFHVSWAMMDFNTHMKNTAYLDLSADVRMFFFETHGFPMREFERHHIGPVVMQDRIDYKRELRLLEEVTVALELTGLSPDGTRFSLRNTFYRPDGKVAAIVSTEAGWLNIGKRCLTVPPEALLDALNSLAKSNDFAELRAAIRSPV